MSVLASGVVAPLTWARVFTAWRPEPGVLAAVVALAGAYGLGLRARARRGRDGSGGDGLRSGVDALGESGRWPRSRSWCFGLGTLSIALVGCAFIGVYDDTLFWTRAVQNIVLLMVAPMLLALGAPLSLLRDALPPGRRPPLSRLLHSAPARLLGQPLVMTLVLTMPLLVLYLSPLYEATLRSPLASGVSGTLVAVAGFLYFWTRFRIDPTPTASSYGITLVITMVEMIGDAVLGVVLWLGPTVAAGFYAALARDWGPDLRTDQLLGAGVLWVGGDVVGLPFIMIVLGRMHREDEVRAERIDAELDALDEARAAAERGRIDLEPGEARADDPVPSGGAAAQAGTDPAARLWWEDDPELAERFRRR